MYVRRKSIGSYVRFGMDILGDTRAVIDSMGYNAPALTNVSGVTIVNPADATANTRHYAQCYINTTEWVRLYIVFHFTTGTLYETITCGLYCYRASSIAWQDAPVVLVGLPKLEIGDHPTAWTQEKDMLRRTGVYIEDGTIQLRSNKVTFANSAGTVDDKISIDPTTGTLITFDAILRGNLFLPYTHITQSNWSDYGTYDSSTGTTYNLLGEIAGKSNAGLNLCVEYIQTIPGTVNTAQVRLPDLTNTNPDRWVGCEVNILNSMDEDLYVRGTLNTGNGFFGLRSWQGTGWNTSDHNVIINPGKEGKFKLVKTMTGTPQYFWICCYANLNQ